MSSTPSTGTESSGSLTSTDVRRTISPYDLSSADNLGAIISYPFFKGNNYDKWECGLRMTLTSKKKFEFLDGSIQKPTENSQDFEDWKTIQTLLVFWMKMTIDPTLRSTISHRDVAKDLWEHLNDRKRWLHQEKRALQFRLLENCGRRYTANGTFTDQMTAQFRNVLRFCSEQENRDSVLYNQNFRSSYMRSKHLLQEARSFTLMSMTL